MRCVSFAGFMMGCLLACGCSHVRERTDALRSVSKELMPWTEPTEKEVVDARPVKMVVIWSESVIYGPGHNPTRGLGGRIYVYNHRHQPIAVDDAELIVYAYDDTKDGHPNTATAVPDRKYVVTKEQFASHYSPSEFGPSYSVWIPWDKVGSQSTSLSVVPVLKTAEGQALVGDHSRALLPGKDGHPQPPPSTDPAAPAVPMQQNNAMVMQTTYERQPEPHVDHDRISERDTMASSTIRVPASMRKRLAQSKPDLPPTKRTKEFEPTSESRRFSVSRSDPPATISSTETVPMRPRPSFQRLAGRQPTRPRVLASQSVLRARDPYLEPTAPEESPSARSFQPSTVSRVLDARNSDDAASWSQLKAARELGTRTQSATWSEN